MGKYDEVLPTLPKLDPLDGTSTDYRARVGSYRDLFKQDPEFKQQAGYMARKYADLRAAKAEVEEELSAINAQIAAMEGMLFEQMEVEGVSQLKMPDGASVNIGYEPSAKVINKEAFRLWCIANGFEKALQLWPSTTNAECKNRLLQGLPDPDGVSVQARQKIRFSKG